MSPSDSSRIRVMGGTSYLDGATPMGVKVASKNDDGWLHVDITADESIKGYCVTINGKSVPITTEGTSDATTHQQ